MSGGLRLSKAFGALAIGLALSAMPLEGAVIAKCFAHWVTTGLPLVVLSPFLAVLLDLDASAIPVQGHTAVALACT